MQTKATEQNKLIPVGDVPKYLPVPVSRSGIQRWIDRGINGQKLEVTRVGSRVFTTPKEIEKFLNYCQK